LNFANVTTNKLIPSVDSDFSDTIVLLVEEQIFTLLKLKITEPLVLNLLQL